MFCSSFLYSKRGTCFTTALECGRFKCSWGSKWLSCEEVSKAQTNCYYERRTRWTGNKLSWPLKLTESATDWCRTSWSTGSHQCFVFGRSRVQSLTQRPAILTAYSWFFSVPSGKCRFISLKLGHNNFLPNPFQSIVNLSPFISMLYISSNWNTVFKQPANKANRCSVRKTVLV
jgi:hypothetical protein